MEVRIPAVEQRRVEQLRTRITDNRRERRRLRRALVVKQCLHLSYNPHIRRKPPPGGGGGGMRTPYQAVLPAPSHSPSSAHSSFAPHHTHCTTPNQQASPQLQRKSPTAPFMTQSRAGPTARLHPIAAQLPLPTHHTRYPFRPRHLRPSPAPAIALRRHGRRRRRCRRCHVYVSEPVLR